MVQEVMIVEREIVFAHKMNVTTSVYRVESERAEDRLAFPRSNSNSNWVRASRPGSAPNVRESAR